MFCMKCVLCINISRPEAKRYGYITYWLISSRIANCWEYNATLTYIFRHSLHLLLKRCFSATNSNQEPPDLAHLPVQLVHGHLPLQREPSQEGKPPQENPLQGPEDPVVMFNHPVQWWTTTKLSQSFLQVVSKLSPSPLKVVPNLSQSSSQIVSKLPLFDHPAQYWTTTHSYLKSHPASPWESQESHFFWGKRFPMWWQLFRKNRI